MQKTKRWPSPLLIVCVCAVIALGVVLLAVGDFGGGLIVQSIGFGVFIFGLSIAKNRKAWQCKNCGYHYEVD